MAIFNGTQVADTISGTNEDDIITGLAGDDVINGASGNDTITGGDGVDNILGNSGDDTIIIESIDDLNDGVDTIDGAGDDDTLVTPVADSDLLLNSATATLLGQTVDIDKIEYFQISNASDYVLTAGENDVFAIDQTISDDQTVAGSSAGATSVEGATYNGATGAIDFNGVAFDETAGIVINGTTYAAGDTYTTAAGGSVAITFLGTEWQLNYTAAQQTSIELGETTEDEVLAIQATQATTNAVIDAELTLDMTSGNNIDLDALGVTADTRIVANVAGSIITDGAGMDTLIGNTAADTFTLQSDADNTVWAGATDAAGDTVNITGDGDNEVGLGAGTDTFNVSGNGANTLYGGAAADDFNFTGAEGNNTVWAGAGDDADTFDTDAASTGNFTFGGGGGADVLNIAGTGDYTLYLGPDDANDVLNVADTADGDFTIFGGAGSAGTGANTITILGDGTNTVFNGNGDDAVILTSAEGTNTLYGGAGDDSFTIDTNTNATFVFVSGNGADDITGFEVDNADHVVDLSDLGFADADDVLNNMSIAGGNAELFVTAGQVITFNGFANLSDFQTADPADWLIL